MEFDTQKDRSGDSHEEPNKGTSNFMKEAASKAGYIGKRSTARVDFFVNDLAQHGVDWHTRNC